MRFSIGSTGTPYELYTTLLPYDTETLLYVMAKSGTEKAKRLISIYFSRLKNTRVEIRGKDLLSMGYSQGPLFREILEGLLEARLNDLVKTREDEIEFVRERWPSGNQAKPYPSRRGKVKVSALAS